MVLGKKCNSKPLPHQYKNIVKASQRARILRYDITIYFRHSPLQVQLWIPLTRFPASNPPEASLSSAAFISHLPWLHTKNLEPTLYALLQVTGCSLHPNRKSRFPWLRPTDFSLNNYYTFPSIGVTVLPLDNTQTMPSIGPPVCRSTSLNVRW